MHREAIKKRLKKKVQVIPTPFGAHAGIPEQDRYTLTLTLTLSLTLTLTLTLTPTLTLTLILNSNPKSSP